MILRGEPNHYVAFIKRKPNTMNVLFLFATVLFELVNNSVFVLRVFISKYELTLITIEEHQFQERDSTLFFIKKNRNIMNVVVLVAIVLLEQLNNNILVFVYTLVNMN
jgi:hypothetical protein